MRKEHGVMEDNITKKKKKETQARYINNGHNLVEFI